MTIPALDGPPESIRICRPYPSGVVTYPPGGVPPQMMAIMRQVYIRVKGACARSEDRVCSDGFEVEQAPKTTVCAIPSAAQNLLR